MSENHDKPRDDRQAGFDVSASTLTRRRFIGVTTASLAATALGGCAPPPPEKIVPYVHRPPEVVPGESTYYATATSRDGYAIGLLGESREGRPIKIEGNPAHPMSLGATGLWDQAALYDLYDPDRIQAISHARLPSSWNGLASAFAQSSAAPHGSAGRGLHVLLEPTSSATTALLVDRLRSQLPEAHVHFDPTTAPTRRWEGAQRFYGKVLEPQHDFERARVVVALDANFLTSAPASLRWAHDFATARHMDSPDGTTNRLYSVSPSLDVTSAKAEHHLALPSSQVHALAVELLAEVVRRVGAPEPLAGALANTRATGPHAGFVRALAADLASHRGESVVVVGDHQPAEVHVVGHALNEVLGNTGKVTWLTASPILEAGGAAFNPGPLLSALDAGEVATLLIGSFDPVYAAPFRDALRALLPKAEQRVYLTSLYDETADLCTWVVPRAHFLESWSDGRGYDGTHTLTQPLIDPLYGGRTVDECLSLLLGAPEYTARDLVQEAWASTPASQGGRRPSLDETLADGLVRGSAAARAVATPQWGEAARATRAAPMKRELEVDLRPDHSVRRGEQANNAWLEECPDPITKVVWDNVALLAPSRARALGVKEGDVIEVAAGGRKIRVPAHPQPGTAEDALVLHLGYGRTGKMAAARGAGVDVAPLRSPDHPWVVPNAKVRATGETYEVVKSQTQDRIPDERTIVLRTTVGEWQRHPDFAEPHDETPPDIYPERLHGSPQWGMGIDLSTCTGCAACVVACQAENNLPVVGKGEVGMRRQMHWLRIDRYYTGGEDHPEVHFQPMMCQHCEKAPCEYVCPVNATVHSSDGLNEMVYNRCVGTRFCSNNCPYKVRRFNFLEYNGNLSETEKMMKNPDVTVRARGVMEKCTYCVQRIRRAQIEARVHDQPLDSVPLQTACQQACPSRAIVFGRVDEPSSHVSRWHALSQAFAELHDVGTRPRTRYLAEVTNPNDEVPS